MLTQQQPVFMPIKISLSKMSILEQAGLPHKSYSRLSLTASDMPTKTYLDLPFIQLSVTDQH